ncbi:hypothetical protein COV24_04245 [candidate division WWE3 bacterium CG10_big_fil_rev_8_21_14_0_10_32_10]|uniref:Glucose/Sorbosone dehydrogenase domain-containing protein n=1 Tax=candidate division WWE3 bacterium CG10_big_fil_rev_8_21_14_0_10_32_10 TaxID=1975090 RepID=A0A2H0R9K1_UNCKA|nr:MAG: hypothetical protein COV24_04245 [candidate division WWE3 bacterium CG10_big_fil_rev_8_21_14_0_10_32_10]
MLAKIYDLLIIFLVIAASLLVGYVVWNRDNIFKSVSQALNPPNEPENLIPVSAQIDSKWLPYTTPIRNKNIYVKPGLQSIVFAAGLNLPQVLTLVDNFVVISEVQTGNIVVLEDSDYDNSSDIKYIFDSNLSHPYGLGYYNGDLYVATDRSLLVYKNFISQFNNKTSNNEILVNNLPMGGLNPYKSLLVGPNNRIYVSIGSSCQSCVELDKRRGSIVSYDLNGEGEEIFATGFKNISGMEFLKGALYVTDEGINSSKNIGLDEIDKVYGGKFYGWPYIYNVNTVNTEYSQIPLDLEQNYTGPEVNFETGVNPSGLAYINFDDTIFSGLMLVSLRGNALTLGHKIIAYNVDTKEYEDIISFQKEDANYLASPTDVIGYRKGILVSDKLNGIIYYFGE